MCSSVLSHSWISPEKTPFVVEERGKENDVSVRLLSRERLVCISVACVIPSTSFLQYLLLSFRYIHLSCFTKGKLCADGPNIAGKSQVGSLPLANNVQHFHYGHHGPAHTERFYVILNTRNGMKFCNRPYTRLTLINRCLSLLPCQLPGGPRQTS